MLPYQLQMIKTFLKVLPRKTMDILEIGSDMDGEVAVELLRQTGARIIGINSSPEFPKSVSSSGENVFFLRADGRSLPFLDNSFDAVVSVATLEHVHGIDAFLKEVTRVLKPKGVFFTEYGPIWSSARGHHVYAVAGQKEARFWKPGKNPIPDYGHLLLTPDEMRKHLQSSPCTDELIGPIIQWIYYSESINRCNFEDYMKSFQKCPLTIQHLSFEYDTSDIVTLNKLQSQYGTKPNFTCSSISAVFRKNPQGTLHRVLFFGWIRTYDIVHRSYSKLLIIIRAAVRVTTTFFRR